MTEVQLTPEEVAALAPPSADAQRPAAPGVKPRDFRLPLRFSPERLEELRLALATRIGGLADTLRPLLRERFPVDLDSLGETSFHTALESALRDDSEVIASFAVGNESGWLLWDRRAARRAVQHALGTAPPEGEIDAPAAPLSLVETALLGELLDAFVHGLAHALATKPGPTVLHADAAQLRLRLDELRDSDAQRLTTRLTFAGPGGESALRILWPAITPAAKRATAPAAALPAHLGDVPVTLSAVLGRIELPLASLLALELGDVVPLPTKLDEPVVLEFDEHPCATATLGTYDGRIAIRLERAITLLHP